MDEKDKENLMRLPYNMHASDGAVRVRGEGIPHPRNSGTFPRVIGHFERERGVIPSGGLPGMVLYGYGKDPGERK